MTRYYLDTSAAVKLAVEEDRSAELAATVERWQEDASVVTSELTVTELHRAARRAGFSPQVIGEVIEGLDIIDVSRAAFRLAGRLPGRHLRSLDAVHIAVAVEQVVDVFVTYDRRQAVGAAEAGLEVLSP